MKSETQQLAEAAMELAEVNAQLSRAEHSAEMEITTNLGEMAREAINTIDELRIHAARLRSERDNNERRAIRAETERDNFEKRLDALLKFTHERNYERDTRRMCIEIDATLLKQSNIETIYTEALIQLAHSLKK